MRGTHSLLLAALLLGGLAHADSGLAPASATDSGADPYQWLEQIHSGRSMDWVEAHNAATFQQFMQSRAFQARRQKILEVIDYDVRIPYVERMGDYLYNFWQDSSNPSGVWRRTSLDEFRKPAPQWIALLSLNKLERPNNSHWIFEGAQCLKPRFQRCLVSLSAGGTDAIEIHEFDVAHKQFVEDGFELPAARTRVSWIDENTIYVSTSSGPGSMTDSGYPRIVKVWKRGTPLAHAPILYEGKASDLAVNAWHDLTPGFERDFIKVAQDFFDSQMYRVSNGHLDRVEIPDDADAEVHREWLLVKLRSPWTVGGKTWPAGALLATGFDDFMAGKRDFSMLFKPDTHTSLSSWNWTRHHLILNELRDVQSTLEVLSFQSGEWAHAPIAGLPAMSTIHVVDTDPDNSDEYWLAITGFLAPTTLQRGDLDGGKTESFKHLPDFFGAALFEVSQHFVASSDGTLVPYFQIAQKGMRLDGSNPTLLYGYGGFEQSQQPSYDGSLGRAWLQRGGVYVVANIRGGGEYGPDWHKAAMQGNRHRAYEDFAAVAHDLIRRGVTSARHLGAEGGSNGGLLVGNMLTTYPDLFGAIACEFPLLDMKRYPHLSAGASWLAEFGNPDTSDWDFIKGFSPYLNLKPDMHYPPVLFYAATSDDRVGPAHARKMVAKMQAMGYPNVWYYENTEGGHGTGANDMQQATMHSLVYDFLWAQLR